MKGGEKVDWNLLIMGFVVPWICFIVMAMMCVIVLGTPIAIYKKIVEGNKAARRYLAEVYLKEVKIIKKYCKVLNIIWLIFCIIQCIVIQVANAILSSMI